MRNLIMLKPHNEDCICDRCTKRLLADHRKYLRDWIWEALKSNEGKSPCP